MKDIKTVIYYLISVVAILFPIGFLLGIFDGKTAFSTIFIILGCQQLFNSIFLVAKDSMILRFISFVIGGLFLLIGLMIFFRTNYI